ncbi:MAG: hypothetical protein ACLSDQ_03950 [Adlercreutzia equolifaciens]
MPRWRGGRARLAGDGRDRGRRERAPAEFGDAGAGRLVFEKTDGPHRVHVTVEKRTYAVTAVVAAGNGAVSPGGRR